MTGTPLSLDQTRSALPHLIHIGFAKCGSTWLQHWFDDHPQIAYKPGGLAGMWNIYNLIEATNSPANGLRCRVTSAEQISQPIGAADAATFDPAVAKRNLHQTDLVCEALARLFPDAHILIVTRGFAPLLRSGYSQMVRHGGHLIEKDFLELKHHYSAGFRAIFESAIGFDYDHCIDLYRRHFGNRVLVLPFEMLVEDQRGFLSEIEQAMGLDAWEGADHPVNPSLSPEELYWYPRIARLLRAVPSSRVGAKLIALHRAAIARGWWHLFLPALRLLWGRREREHGYPHITEQQQIERYAHKARELVKLPHYAPYRAAYGAKDPQ